MTSNSFKFPNLPNILQRSVINSVDFGEFPKFLRLNSKLLHQFATRDSFFGKIEDLSFFIDDYVVDNGEVLASSLMIQIDHHLFSSQILPDNRGYLIKAKDLQNFSKIRICENLFIRYGLNDREDETRDIQEIFNVSLFQPKNILVSSFIMAPFDLSDWRVFFSKTKILAIDEFSLNTIDDEINEEKKMSLLELSKTSFVDSKYFHTSYPIEELYEALRETNIEFIDFWSEDTEKLDKSIRFLLKNGLPGRNRKMIVSGTVRIIIDEEMNLEENFISIRDSILEKEFRFFELKDTDEIERLSQLFADRKAIVFGEKLPSGLQINGKERESFVMKSIFYRKISENRVLIVMLSIQLFHSFTNHGDLVDMGYRIVFVGKVFEDWNPNLNHSQRRLFPLSSYPEILQEMILKSVDCGQYKDLLRTNRLTRRLILSKRPLFDNVKDIQIMISDYKVEDKRLLSTSMSISIGSRGKGKHLHFDSDPGFGRILLRNFDQKNFNEMKNSQNFFLRIGDPIEGDGFDQTRPIFDVLSFLPRKFSVSSFMIAPFGSEHWDLVFENSEISVTDEFSLNTLRNETFSESQKNCLIEISETVFHNAKSFYSGYRFIDLFEILRKTRVELITLWDETLEELKETAGALLTKGIPTLNPRVSLEGSIQLIHSDQRDFLSLLEEFRTFLLQEKFGLIEILEETEKGELGERFEREKERVFEGRSLPTGLRTNAKETKIFIQRFFFRKILSETRIGLFVLSLYSSQWEDVHKYFKISFLAKYDHLST